MRTKRTNRLAEAIAAVELKLLGLDEGLQAKPPPAAIPARREGVSASSTDRLAHLRQPRKQHQPV
jgi:hypothetical protein